MQGQNYNPYTGAPLSGIDPPAVFRKKAVSQPDCSAC